MLGALAEHISRAAANGDLDAARVAHQAIGHLLGLPTLLGPTDDLTQAADLTPDALIMP